MNVASTAAFYSGPYMAVYFATKAFVLAFSEALDEELAGSGVTVTCLCPGPTATEFREVAGSTKSKAAERPQEPSMPVAEAGVEAMLTGQRLYIPAPRIASELHRAAPRRMMTRIVGHPRRSAFMTERRRSSTGSSKCACRARLACRARGGDRAREAEPDECTGAAETPVADATVPSRRDPETDAKRTRQAAVEEPVPYIENLVWGDIDLREAQAVMPDNLTGARRADQRSEVLAALRKSDATGVRARARATPPQSKWTYYDYCELISTDFPEFMSG
jgi:hypothetical protein